MQFSNTLMQSLYPQSNMKNTATHSSEFPSTLDPILEQSTVGQELQRLSQSLSQRAISRIEEIAADDNDVDVEKELGLPELPQNQTTSEPDLLSLDFAEMSIVEQKFWLNKLMQQGSELAGKLRVGIGNGDLYLGGISIRNSR